MARYDDRDLFKKLNKEKPLVKQMDKGSLPPSGLNVRKMDLAQRPERQKPVEIFNTPPVEAQKSGAPKRKFKEFSAAPAAVREEKKDLRTDLMEPKKETVRTEPRERRIPAPPREPRVQKPSLEVIGAKNTEVSAQTRARYEFKPEKAQTKRAYRHELKYYINPCDYELLKSAMSSLLLPDENSVNGGYHIRSLYFDDFENSAVAEKINGVKHRKKYRIRIYNKSAGMIRLERKLKEGELVSKDGMILTRDEVESILDGSYSFLLGKQNQLAHDFYIELQTRGLRPVTIVDYYREAYVHHIEDVRITFDSDLRSGVFDKNIFNQNLQTLPMFENELMVMEVKFNHYLPQYIKVILNNAGYVSRSAVSKYVICRKYE